MRRARAVTRSHRDFSQSVRRSAAAAPDVRGYRDGSISSSSSARVSSATFTGLVR